MLGCDRAELQRYAQQIDDSVTTVVLLESVATSTTQQLHNFTALDDLPDLRIDGVSESQCVALEREGATAWLDALGSAQSHVAGAATALGALVRVLSK